MAKLELIYFWLDRFYQKLVSYPTMILTQKTNFFDLDPNIICLCAERHGFKPTGEILQLNSIENRVFDIRLEMPENEIKDLTKRNSLIAKFYRPGRWSKKTIIDEHDFEIELKNESLEVAAPIILSNNETVDLSDGIYYAFFEKIRGRLIQEYLPHHFKQIGNWLARLHNIGESKVALNRFEFGPSAENKWEQLDALAEVIAPEVRNEYLQLATEIFESLDDQLSDFDYLRIHGDLHRGNILESPEGLVVVDFDDFLNGPAVQDFWMLFPEENFEESVEFENFRAGYEELRLFPEHQLHIVPLLRAYRIISYSAWIHRRWDDPSFLRLFPHFHTYNYWVEQTDAIRRLSATL